jgi:uncharacterized repeat protein (TIGR01451 family)
MRARVALILAILGLTLAATAAPVSAGAPVASADLSVTKSDTPDPVAAGGLVTYHIIVENTGPDSAFDIEVVDTIPAGTTVDEAGLTGWTVVVAPPTITVTNAGPLASGASADIVVELIVDPGVLTGTILTNSVTVTSSTNDPDLDNNSATAQTTVNPGAVPPTPTPTPQGSLLDAAMPASGPGSPLEPLAFAILLVASLTVLAVFTARARASRR